MAGKKGGGYRSAISGRYVTTKHGKASPRTTLREASGRFVTTKHGKASPNTTTREK